MTLRISHAIAPALALFLATAAHAQERLPEAVYRATCAYCHGHYVAPGVTVAPELQGRKLPPALVSSFVRNGLGRMPAFQPTAISDAELAALSLWIQASPAPAAPPAPPAPVVPGARP
jgi:mono/diheme cytochrome c family protein